MHMRDRLWTALALKSHALRRALSENRFDENEKNQFDLMQENTWSSRLAEMCAGKQIKSPATPSQNKNFTLKKMYVKKKCT